MVVAFSKNGIILQDCCFLHWLQGAVGPVSLIAIAPLVIRIGLVLDEVLKSLNMWVYCQLQWVQYRSDVQSFPEIHEVGKWGLLLPRRGCKAKLLNWRVSEKCDMIRANIEDWPSWFLWTFWANFLDCWLFPRYYAILTIRTKVHFPLFIEVRNWG